MDMGLTEFQKSCLGELDDLHNAMIREVIRDWDSKQKHYIVRVIVKP